jgi:hypothetical protein
MEHERFEGWVRVLCAGPLALAAYVVYAAHAGGPPRALLYVAFLAAFAAGFAIWPERLAYGYRHGAGGPRWSKGTSVTRVEDGASGEARERFADYRPSLRHLRSAYFSVVVYSVAAVRLPRPRDAALVWGLLLGAAAILYLATRNAPAE